MFIRVNECDNIYDAMRKNLLLTSTLFAIGLSTAYPLPAKGKDMLGLSLGYYDLRHDNDGLDMRLEYKALNIKLLDHISPFAGIEATGEGSLWIGGGFMTELKLNDQWMITPSIGAGYYNKGGDDIDLGHSIEFRSQIELSYQFENKNRIGLSFSHMSNAGLGDKNPGTETISLSYTFPFDKLF